MSSIKTPDQRLRVFVSSTLQELEQERKTAREAIQKLRLIPVLFETGARPHPPRDLYRAYLDQSHVFIGIYWNSYGWVAPDMEISGLEDEFWLSANKPRLIYVKHTSERQPRLTELLQKMQDGDSVTYQKFVGPEDFRELLENDLAILLSERFESHDLVHADKKDKAIRQNLPVIRNALIGREKELASIHQLFFQPDLGLLTILGSGGTGKSRLALEFAHQVKDRFPDGVYFVSLAPLNDYTLVPSTIANVLGLLDAGQQPIRETLIDFLADKNTLLILDNFEHVIEAGTFVSDLLGKCPSIKILVTSRTSLHIRDEQIFTLSPLEVPSEKDKISEYKDSPCIRLFVDKAIDVNPNIKLSDENYQAMAEICRKLDGLPLAIELAAARTKILSPLALLNRMDKSLDLLSQGARDLPQRHQTIRATIDWSYKLLDESARYFFRQLSVFGDGWTLGSSEAATNAVLLKMDVLDYTDKLLNVGLIQPKLQNASNDEPRFSMLMTVKEYAEEMLIEKNEAIDTRLRHANYFENLLTEAQPDLWSGDPLPWFEKLDAEYQNISLAFHFFIEYEKFDAAWNIIGSLTQFWTSRGRFSEAFHWMDLAGVHVDVSKNENVTKHHQARALLSRGILTFLSGNFLESIRYLEQSEDLFLQLNETSGIARAKTYMGAARISLGDHKAIDHFQEAIRLADDGRDEFSYVMSSAFLGEVNTAMFNYEVAGKLLSAAEIHARSSPQKVLLAVVLLQKGSYNLMQDNFHEGLVACKESVEVFENSGFKSMKGWAQHVLAQSYLMTNDLEKAFEYFNEGIASGREAGDKTMVLFGMIGFGSIAFVKGQYELSATLMGAAEAMIRMTGYAFWSTDKKLYQWLIENLEEKLDKESLSLFRTRGEGLSVEKAISLAQTLKVD